MKQETEKVPKLYENYNISLRIQIRDQKKAHKDTQSGPCFHVESNYQLNSVCQKELWASTNMKTRHHFLPIQNVGLYDTGNLCDEHVLLIFRFDERRSLFGWQRFCNTTTLISVLDHLPRIFPIIGERWFSRFYRREIPIKPSKIWSCKVRSRSRTELHLSRCSLVLSLGLMK